MAPFIPWKRIVLTAIFGCILLTHAAVGQIIYGSLATNGQRYFYKFNLATCEFCAITPPLGSGFGGGNITVLPNGQIIRTAQALIMRTEGPPSTTVLWESTPGFFCGELAPNGLVYLSNASGFSIYDPATNNITFIGSWPSGIINFTELFYINGVLHGFAVNTSNGQSVLVQINTANPSQSTIVGPIPNLWGGEGGTWNGNEGVFYIQGSNNIYFYNPANGSSTLICDLPNTFFMAGLFFPPPGIPEYPCLSNCTTNAGSIPQAGPYNICTNSTLNFPAATGAALDANDLLRYVLFSNPADTAGSIVTTSSTPSFGFNPATMQTGVTYYIAAMAGDGAGGSVDLNDPCLDFSNALQLVWQPLPAVSFSVTGGNPNLCNGECSTVLASLTGTPPFTLTYTTPAGTFSQTFSSDNGSFQVCAPAGSTPGALPIQATALVDGWCTCE